MMLDALAHQLSLPGLAGAEALFTPDVVTPRDGQTLSQYNLFLAIFPQQAEALHLAQAMAAIRAAHGLVGKPLAPERLHITLCGFKGFLAPPPQAYVDAIIAAIGPMACAPLPIAFDHIQNFKNNPAYVLQFAEGSDAAVIRFQQLLALKLRRARLRPQLPSSLHMTMLYGKQPVATHAITPLCWTATRFALVLSHVGLEHHQWVREWQLTA